MQVMSGFRTPLYNARAGERGGRSKISRHMYGDAADVFVGRRGVLAIPEGRREYPEVNDRPEPEKVGEREEAGVDVDHVDGWVLYQIIEGFITAIQAECASGLDASVRRAAQQSFYLDTLPSKRFQMRSPNKSQANDRRS